MMSLPPEEEGSSLKEVQSACVGRDPDQDSLDSDSLGGDDIHHLDHGATVQRCAGLISSSPRPKCFMNASDLMGDEEADAPSARPDVLPPATEPSVGPATGPPAGDVSRLQHEEKLKGSLLFSGSGSSTPEVLLSPQRRAPPSEPCVVEPLLSDTAREAAAGRPRDGRRPDLVSAGGGDGQTDGPLPAATAGDGADAGSPRRRPPPGSLDDVPIVAGHHEPPLQTEPPPRRQPDPHQVFFVDLNTLPVPVEPPPPSPARRWSRGESDSVFLYIDLSSEHPSAGDGMSLSYHGGGSGHRGRRAVDIDEGPASDPPTGRGLFYTVGQTVRPQPPPQQLTAPPPRLEKRRRNLSLDCQARLERERPATGRERQSPLLSGRERLQPVVGRSSVGATPEPARRAACAPEPRRQESRPRTAGRRPVPAPSGSRVGDPPSIARDQDSSDRQKAAGGRARAAAAVVVPPRHRSTQRSDTRRKPAERAQPPPSPSPPESKPQRSFLRSHSGRNAVSQPARPAPSSGSGGTLTRRKAAAAAPEPPPPPPPPPPPAATARDSPVFDDAASDGSSAKSYRRQSPETRNKLGMDELTSDLLQMLSDGVHADVTIQVDGQEVPAHRCVLAARSKYFRNLLEKPQHNVVHIDGHKLETVEFVLFHLYSGAMYVPEDVDLSDLLTLAVMLGHKQLIRMAEFAMRVRLCHMFHKPCSECIPGVLETLCTAADCDLDDLAARCLAWVTQNRVIVWADPSFSEITDEYRAWCFQEAATLSQETVLDVLLDCRLLSAQLPAARWSQPVRDMVETLLSNSVVYLSRNLGAILVSDRFMSVAESNQYAQLEQYLLAAADVQNSADAHTSLEMVGQLQSIPHNGWDKNFLAMLQRIKQVCNRRASGGQNYASIHLQRRSVRAQGHSATSEVSGVPL